mmetsp:Transcript_29327/g.65849  ORF Transcript_29327/g.65849 Transcript_29327/m.65849 type:complete len:175 (-) Transcript_29327:117-641(-)
MSNQNAKTIVEPSAVRVTSQELKVKIPSGLNPGDSFLHTPQNGQTFTVIVPEGASGGQFISIIMPDEVTGVVDTEAGNSSISCEGGSIKISKAAAGAGLVGGIVGACVLGPIGALALGAGAIYCTTRADGRIGSPSRDVGAKAYSGAEKAKNWIVKKMNTPTAEPVASVPMSNR